MKVIEVRRQIAASPEAVWAVLTDPARLVGGSLGITKLEGRIAAGQTIALESKVAPGRVFRLKVQACDAPRRMVWTSGVPLIFNGTRTFMLAPERGGTAFHMAEVYRGLMLPLIWRSMPEMQPGFELFADGLKRLTEGA